MIGRLNHVAIAVTDLAAAAAQYRELLGARVLGDGEPKIGAHDKPVLFLHPKDFSGTLIELEQA
jgi:methylmalonyl-CoA/ethylmalonyl-CoA epimerase